MEDMFADDGWSCDGLRVTIGGFEVDDDDLPLKWIELILTDKDGRTAKLHLDAHEMRSLVDYLENWCS